MLCCPTEKVNSYKTYQSEATINLPLANKSHKVALSFDSTA